MSIFAVLDPKRNDRARQRKLRDQRRRNLVMGVLITTVFIGVLAACIGLMISLGVN